MTGVHTAGKRVLSRRLFASAKQNGGATALFDDAFCHSLSFGIRNARAPALLRRVVITVSMSWTALGKHRNRDASCRDEAVVQAER